jgi:Fe-S-cluster containining protein
MDETICFCGSGKAHTLCHGDINPNSPVARLYLVQRQLDAAIEKQRRENNLPVKCRAGCAQCCARCFNVSEPEAAQILEALSRRLAPADISRLIRKANDQWALLASEYPALAQAISGPILLEALGKAHETVLPFPCLFLDEEGRCTIYEVRPLICRIYGAGRVSWMGNSRPCTHLPPLHTARDRYADLSGFEETFGRYAFLEYDGQYIMRRPVPLFYYFHLLFKDPERPAELLQTPWYRNLTELDDEAYIESLVKEPDITLS